MNHDDARLVPHANAVARDAGHRRDDDEFALVLEQIHGRLPRRRRATGHVEKATMQALGLVDQVAGFRPHPVRGISSAHVP